MPCAASEAGTLDELMESGFWKVTLALCIGDVLKEPEGIFLFAIFPPAAVPQLIKL